MVAVQNDSNGLFRASRSLRSCPYIRIPWGPWSRLPARSKAKRVPLARSNPLHTNIGACKESIAPLASKLAVEHGFLHWSHTLLPALSWAASRSSAAVS